MIDTIQMITQHTTITSYPSSWFIVIFVYCIVVFYISNHTHMITEAFIITTTTITSLSISSYKMMNNQNKLLIFPNNNMNMNTNHKKINDRSTTTLHDYYNDDTTYTLSVEEDIHNNNDIEEVHRRSSNNRIAITSTTNIKRHKSTISSEKIKIKNIKRNKSNLSSSFIIESKNNIKTNELFEHNNIKNNIQQQQQQQQQKKLDNYVHRGYANVEFVAETNLPTQYGMYRLRGYRISDCHHIGQEPCVIYYPHYNNMNDNDDITKNEKQQQQQSQIPYQLDNINPDDDDDDDAIPVRIHDQCMTSEVFGSLRCDCKEQLDISYQYIQKNGGIIIYLQQEGRGIGITNKIAAYSLQDTGIYDTVDSNRILQLPDDNRDYHIISSILNDLNITKIKLMTNNPRKTKHLIQLGINVIDTIPIVIPKANKYNYRYMKAKEERMEHQNLHQLTSEMIQITSSSSKHELSLLNPSLLTEEVVHPNTINNNNNNDNIISTSEMNNEVTQKSLKKTNHNIIMIPSSPSTIVDIIEKSPITITMIITMWIMIIINIVS